MTTKHSSIFYPNALNTLYLACFIAASPLAHASYATHEQAAGFAAEMEEKHGFSADEVLQTLAQANRNARVIKLITPSTSPISRSWQTYRARLLDRARIDNGVDFWLQYDTALHNASQHYGVPAEIIVSIIGIESNYGRYTGNFETLSALATLAFDYPPRAPLFRRELENLLLLAREQSRNPRSYSGSYAGAVGYPQFLPSSIRHYAVDFDNSGNVDLELSPVDAIGSIANYLAQHGWQSAAPVAIQASIPADSDISPLLDAGIEPRLDPAVLQQYDITRIDGRQTNTAPATLVSLETPGLAPEYWLGYQNFYVITRYNKSSFYAMAVYQLAEAIKARYSSLAR